MKNYWGADDRGAKPPERFRGRGGPYARKNYCNGGHHASIFRPAGPTPVFYRQRPSRRRSTNTPAHEFGHHYASDPTECRVPRGAVARLGRQLKRKKNTTNFAREEKLVECAGLSAGDTSQRGGLSSSDSDHPGAVMLMAAAKGKSGITGSRKSPPLTQAKSDESGHVARVLIEPRPGPWPKPGGHHGSSRPPPDPLPPMDHRTMSATTPTLPGSNGSTSS